MRRVLRTLGRTGGYTLVEMMVTMAILGVIMGGLTTLFVSASNAELDMNFRWQAQQNARLALDKMRREIHCAQTATKGSGVSPANTWDSSAVAGVTISLPSGCSGNSSGSAVNVTWCTQGTSPRYGLYRVYNSVSCSGGTKYADYLTNGNIFDISTVSGSLSKVNVDLPVNRQPTTKPNDKYELKDDIVLRNSTRAS